MISKVFFVIFFSLSTQIAVAGGISGGGGNSLPQNPVGTYGIESILTLNHPKFVAYAFFSSIFTKSHLDKITENGSNLIFDKIKNVNIYIAKDRPCYDVDNNEMDGSTVSPVPNTICISAQRLGKKLSEESAFVQTMALVIHEYSHLIGANEEQAEEIQYSALNDLNRRTFYRNITKSYFEEFGPSYLKFSKILSDSLSVSERPGSVWARFINGGSYYLYQLKANFFLTSDFYLTPYHEARLKALFNKWEIIRKGFTIGHPLEAPANVYENSFGNNEVLRVSDFIKNYSELYRFGSSDWDDTEENSNFLVKKISSHQDYVPAIKELHQEFHSIISEIKDLHYAILMIK